MRIVAIIFALAASLLAGCASADTGTNGVPVVSVVSSPVSPNVIPGTGNINVFNTISPTNFGSPSDYGYNIRGWCNWMQPSLDEVGSSGIAGTRQFSIACAHAPTNAELTSGLGNNVTSVLIRCDIGSWFIIPARSVNTDDGSIDEFTFTVNSPNYTDGIHRCDAQGITSTGPNIIMEGPLEDANHFAPSIRLNTATIDNGAGLAGNTLTATGSILNVNASNGDPADPVPQVGWSVECVGTAPNTFITAVVDATHFTISGAPQLIGSEPCVLGNERSFYFITDYHNTLGRGTHLVYMSPTGNDANNGFTPATAKLTNVAAANVIRTQDPTNLGMYGGIICVLNGYQVMSETGVGSYPTSTKGFLKYIGGQDPRCNNPGDPGGAAFHFDSSSRTYGGLRVWFENLNFLTEVNTLNRGLATQLVAENVSSTGNMYTGGLVGTGAIACMETHLTFSYGGGCSARFARNHTVNYYSEDGFHGAEVSVGSTFTNGGPVYFWATGTSTVGSNVITGVTVPVGYTISQIFTVGGNCASLGISCLGTADASGNTCFPTTNRITAIDDTLHTITTDQVATCGVTNAPLVQPGVHGDNTQMQVNSYITDVYYSLNSWGLTGPGFQQGKFLEADHISGAYFYKNNWFNSTLTPESPLLVSGGNDHIIYDQDQYQGGGAFRQDVTFNSNDETFNSEHCLSGGGFTGAGTNIRRHAAATNACYTSVP